MEPKFDFADPNNVDRAKNLLTAVKEQLNLKNDAALCRAMEVAPPVISKISHGKLPVGAGYIIKIHELTGWPIADIKTRLGMPAYLPSHLRQKAA